MNIMSPNAVLINRNECSPEVFLEQIGRVCYKSEKNITESSAEKFVRMLTNNNHTAMLEHFQIYLMLSKDYYNKLYENVIYDNEYRNYITITDKPTDDFSIVSASVRTFRNLFLEQDRNEYTTSTSVKAISEPLFAKLYQAYPKLFPYMKYSIATTLANNDDIKILTAEDVIYILKDKDEIKKHITHTILFTCDRGVSHELVRHRPASFAQESTRYVAYADKNKAVDCIDDIIECYYRYDLTPERIAELSNGKYTPGYINSIISEYTEKNEIPSISDRYMLDGLDEIDTPEKAYLLGVMSDSYLVQENTLYTCAYCKDDWYLINLFRKFINLDATNTIISNYELIKKLKNKYGIAGSRADDEAAKQLWNSIPEKFRYDFIRGLFDANHAPYPFTFGDNCEMQFGGDSYFMDILYKFIEDTEGYRMGAITQSADYGDRIYCIKNLDVIKSLCNKMYANFKFPYGHPQTSRYFSTFNLTMPVDVNECKHSEVNVILPVDHSKWGTALWTWGNAVFNAETSYKTLIKQGMKPQDARSVLPNSLKTEIVVTANEVEWQHILNLRYSGTTGKPHPQMKELMSIARPKLESASDYRIKAEETD